jgi:molybdenum cofactor biosynthesis protein B
MVDFQSRDTRRVRGEANEDPQSSPDETEDPAGDDHESDSAGTGESEETRDGGTDAGEYGPETLTYAVVTVTGERTLEADETGDAVVDAVEAVGDAVVTRELIAPSYDGVQSALDGLVDRGDVEALVTVGGTGVEPDDVTPDAAEALFDKHLPGFGELFRVLSHEREGTAVVRTRTTAGVVDGVPVFCLPGETDAARRGVEQVVCEEAEALAEAATPTAESD